jgi:hypothetical protein
MHELDEKCKLFDKYSPTDDDLEEWARTSLPMAFDLTLDDKDH